MHKSLPIIVGSVLAGIVILFVAIPGGSAVNGNIVSGHYYLGSHGHYREVSRRIYGLSALSSAAIGLMIPLFVSVMTIWKESRKPSFNRWFWLGPLFALLLGLTLFFSSIRCVTAAFSGV